VPAPQESGPCRAVRERELESGLKAGTTVSTVTNLSESNDATASQATLVGVSAASTTSNIRSTCTGTRGSSGSQIT
jgi:hypothetical protein